MRRNHKTFLLYSPNSSPYLTILSGDLQAGERLATSRQAPLQNTPLRRQRLAASPPAGVLAGGLESTAVRVTPPHFQDPTIRALEVRCSLEEISIK